VDSDYVEKYFGKNEKEWDWTNFKSTEGFPISDRLIDWVIGQDKALEECNLCIDEWVRKLRWLKKRKWWKSFEDPYGEKPPPKEWLPAGPFMLMLGDAGTGKSLIGRALAVHMTRIYKQYNIELNDVVSWKNKSIPSNPKISIHPSPEGKKLVIKESKKEAKRGLILRMLLKGGSIILALLGSFLLFIAFYSLIVPWITNAEISIGLFQTAPIQTVYEGSFFNWVMDYMKGNFPLIMGSGSLIMVAVFIQFFGRMYSGNLTGKGGIGGAENTKAPKLIVDNSARNAPFIDATGHGSAQLFGSIAWDPYQTGGLGTPEHQRVTAGDVHRAHLGILYIDEIKNLTGQEAVTLLTVLEDGQLPIALRSQFHGGDTAAMAVSTEAIPCMVFLIAAGNLDSIPMIHHALMDRIRGYGKLVYMNNTMPNNVRNRRKYTQFISQEIKRFNLLPFSRNSCIEIIEEARRKSDRKDKLTTKFRPMISIIKTASTLASNEGLEIVSPKHIEEAIKEHCKSIEYQVLDRFVKEKKQYKFIEPESKPKIGQIHAAAVYSSGTGVHIGEISLIRASIKKSYKGKESFVVTGVQTNDDTWVQQSIKKICHIIDIPKNRKVHIDFTQNKSVEGPSAGVAMTLALYSALKQIPIRQDTVLTGEINIGEEGIVTPIGGVHAKIMAAQTWGFKRICIPQTNYDLNVNVNDYKIEVIPCKTFADYKKNMLVKK